MRVAPPCDSSRQRLFPQNVCSIPQIPRMTQFPHLGESGFGGQLARTPPSSPVDGLWLIAIDRYRWHSIAIDRPLVRSRRCGVSPRPNSKTRKLIASPWFSPARPFPYFHTSIFPYFHTFIFHRQLVNSSRLPGSRPLAAVDPVLGCTGGRKPRSATPRFGFNSDGLKKWLRYRSARRFAPSSRLKAPTASA